MPRLRTSLHDGRARQRRDSSHGHRRRPLPRPVVRVGVRGVPLVLGRAAAGHATRMDDLLGGRRHRVAGQAHTVPARQARGLPKARKRAGYPHGPPRGVAARGMRKKGLSPGGQPPACRPAGRAVALRRRRQRQYPCRPVCFSQPRPGAIPGPLRPHGHRMHARRLCRGAVARRGAEMRRIPPVGNSHRRNEAAGARRRHAGRVVPPRRAAEAVAPQ